MKVTVSKKNIDQGSRKEAAYCPIAWALTEKGYENVRVYYSSIRCKKGNKLYEAMLPPKVTAFLVRFDYGLPVKPFKFEVELLVY